MFRSTALLALVISVVAAAACTEEVARRRPGTITEGGKELPDYENINETAHEELPNPLAAMKHGNAQIKALCDRAGPLELSNENFNAVTNAFCAEGLRPGSIDALLAALGLSFGTRTADGTNGSNDNPGFALLGHSSSLVARFVSAINPRAFVFSAPQGEPTRLPGFTVMGFVRGEPLIEIAAQDRRARKTTFYLVHFEPSCGDDCAPADLLTPRIESGWKNVTVYDEEDLKNTIFDCRHCHQPDGPGTPAMLRMQELEDPWTHWFRSDRPGGLALLQDYARAHGEDEDYGGIPGPIIQKSDGRAMEDLVKGQGFTVQPNAFDSLQIEKEVTSSSEKQPVVNFPQGESSTWQSIYDAAFRGEFIPVPYHDVKVTDPNKLATATESYRRFKAGQSNTLLDIRRVFLDDALEELSFRSKRGATGEEILVQTCAQCHNPKLDQDISRARFDVTKLRSMTRKQKDETIKRINMKSSELGKMPPAIMRSLDDDAKAKVIEFLSK